MFWFINPFWLVPVEYYYLLLPTAGVVEVPATTAMFVPGVGVVYGS